MQSFCKNLTILLLPIGIAIATNYANATNNQKQLVEEAWQIVDRQFIDITANNSRWMEIRREFLSKDYQDNNTARDAIRTMLGKLNDPETRLVDSQQLAIIQKEGNGQSVGVGLIDFSVETNEKTKELQVVTALADTPAARAGIIPKDIIEAIDGVSTKQLSHDEAMAKLRGQAGTQVTLTIRRGDRTFNVPLKREAISIDPVETSVRQKMGKKIGYIALRQFTPDAAMQIRSAIQNLSNQNVEGFVLDLRNNPGGLLRVGNEIASFFLNKGDLIGIFQTRAGNEEIKASGTKLTNKPLVILVNSGTASAGEILAGALQNNGRAVVVGNSTFGRGRVHSTEELSDKSVMLFAIGRFLSPTGRNIDREGIQPNYALETSTTQLQSHNSLYEKAIAVLIWNIDRTARLG
ncbi:MAG: S41 family peptidase [Hydrococcus sp. Prado102]|jgi:carboxyl-terminal processing protease|nr:S41 family peptidase [Hydrococcus sp. Prado102]